MFQSTVHDNTAQKEMERMGNQKKYGWVKEEVGKS